MWADGEDVPVRAGDAVLAPEGSDHGFRNTGRGPLKLVSCGGSPATERPEIQAGAARGRDSRNRRRVRQAPRIALTPVDRCRLFEYPVVGRGLGLQPEEENVLNGRRRHRVRGGLSPDLRYDSLPYTTRFTTGRQQQGATTEWRQGVRQEVRQLGDKGDEETWTSGRGYELTSPDKGSPVLRPRWVNEVIFSERRGKLKVLRAAGRGLGTRPCPPCDPRTLPALLPAVPRSHLRCAVL